MTAAFLRCSDRLAPDSPADTSFVPSHQYFLLGIFFMSVSLKLLEDKTKKESTMRCYIDYLDFFFFFLKEFKQRTAFLQMEPVVPAAYLEILKGLMRYFSLLNTSRLWLLEVNRRAT